MPQRASSAAAHGEPVVPSSLRQPVEGEAQHLHAGPVVVQQLPRAIVGVDRRAELQHGAQVVGQLAGSSSHSTPPRR